MTRTDLQTKAEATIAGWGSRHWIVRGGAEMRWCEMTVSHLRNAADFYVNATAAELDAIARYCPRGEAAEDAWVSAFRDASDREMVAKLIAKDMRLYAAWRERRGIEPKRQFKEFDSITPDV
jgi:hypothetical protein